MISPIKFCQSIATLNNGTFLPMIGRIEPDFGAAMDFISIMQVTTKRPFSFLIMAVLLISLIVIHKISKEISMEKSDQVSFTADN